MPSLSFVTSQSQHQELPGKGTWQSSLPHSITPSRCVSHLPLHYRENFIQFALKSREIPLTPSEIASGPKCVLWKGPKLLTTERGPKAVSLLHQNKRQSYHLNSCQKDKASTKDRGFATLIRQESIFNVTTAIPEEGQYAWFAERRVGT